MGEVGKDEGREAGEGVWGRGVGKDEGREVGEGVWGRRWGRRGAEKSSDKNCMSS